MLFVTTRKPYCHVVRFNLFGEVPSGVWFAATQTCIRLVWTQRCIRLVWSVASKPTHMLSNLCWSECDFFWSIYLAI